MCGAVQIVPYGEALIHRYYWEGLARLSQNPRIVAVGAQSNFSFPVEEMLVYYRQMGGDVSKLRLWGTFHPEMTSVEDFLLQCGCLLKQGVLYCAGVVGVPERIPEIRRLREGLPPSVYLWINKMDGLKRNYTKEETEFFFSIDEYFELELKHFKADASLCRDSIFVEADGCLYGCNLCRRSMGNLYQDMQWEGLKEDGLYNVPKHCSRRECSCYLSYCNRKEEELLFFQPYPAFRIPFYPKAVFFDVDGTLVPEGQAQISEEYSRRIRALARHSAVFLVTSLPYRDAMGKVVGIRDVIMGGVFANGGRCKMISGKDYDEIASMDAEWVQNIELGKKKYGYVPHIYKKGNLVYKVTLVLPKEKLLANGDAEQFKQQVILDLQIPESCHVLLEDNCLQVSKAGKGKLQGVLEICKIMGYASDEIMVAGNSDNDAEMLQYFPFSVAAKGSSEKAKNAAKVIFKA